MEAALLRRCSLGDPPWQACALRKAYHCFMAVGSPFQFCIPESSSPVFSSWTTLLGKAGPKPTRHLHCLPYSKPSCYVQLREARCSSLLWCLRVAWCNGRLLPLLGWRNGKEKGFAPNSYARRLCSLPRKGLPLLRDGSVIVKPCFVGEIPLVCAANPQ